MPEHPYIQEIMMDAFLRDLKTHIWGTPCVKPYREPTGSAWELDAASLKATDRTSEGLPAVFDYEAQYGYEVRDGRLVCLPIRQRTRTPVSFAGLIAAS